MADLSTLTPAEIKLLVGQMKENAERLGLIWTRRPGTVKSITRNNSGVLANVLLDGATDTGKYVPCTCLVGPVVVGSRVVVDSIPPAGKYVVGTMNALGDGSVIARTKRITNSSGSSGAEVPVSRISGVGLTAGKLYRIHTSQIFTDCSVANDIGRAALRIDTSGADATTSSTEIGIWQAVIPNTSFPEAGAIDVSYTPTTPNQILSILLTVQRVSGTGVITLTPSAVAPLEIFVTQCGDDPGDTGVQL